MSYLIRHVIRTVMEEGRGTSTVIAKLGLEMEEKVDG